MSGNVGYTLGKLKRLYLSKKCSFNSVYVFYKTVLGRWDPFNGLPFPCI